MYFLSGSIVLIEGGSGSGSHQYTYYPNVTTVYSGVGVIDEWEQTGSSLARLRIANGELFAELNTGGGYEIVYSWILDGIQCRIGSLDNLFAIQDYDGTYSTIEDYNYPGYAGTWFRIGTRSNMIVIDEYDGTEWQNIHEMF